MAVASVLRGGVASSATLSMRCSCGTGAGGSFASEAGYSYVVSTAAISRVFLSSSALATSQLSSGIASPFMEAAGPRFGPVLCALRRVSSLQLQKLARKGPTPSLASSSSRAGSADASADDLYGDSSFCIIEGRDTVSDFAPMQLPEIREHINRRRNKIFLLMEEVRRLRIQQRVKSADQNLPLEDEAEDVLEFPSFIPFLPPLTPQTLKNYYVTCFSLISGIMLFAGLLAPVLELRLGIGGTSYEDFIRNMYLPEQLSQVDPIVASFSGGAVGVISVLMVVELNNVKQEEHKRCTYCHGTGYLACARCSGSGTFISMDSLVYADGGSKTMSKRKSTMCSSCAGAAKVMCASCLCTGMALASEHDPRIDPFSI